MNVLTEFVCRPIKTNPIEFQIPGVYLWINKINLKVYVGSSMNLHKRYKSYCNIANTNNSGKESKCFINDALRKYGMENFEFYILQQFISNTNKSIILEKEQYWMDFYKSHDQEIGYNICKMAGSRSGSRHSQNTLNKFKGWNRRNKELSEQEKGRTAKMGRENSKQVLQLEKDTLFIINEFPSAISAAQFINIHPVCMRNSCLKSRLTSGFYWIYKLDYEKHGFIKKIYKNPNDSVDRKILQKDKNGKSIKLWNTINEVCLDGFKKQTIQYAARGESKTAYGFVWEYA